MHTRASISHPVPRLGTGPELRRRDGGVFMPAGRRGAGRLVNRVVGDVPPGWRVGRLPRLLGGCPRGVGRPVGLVQPRLPCERQRPAPCARQNVGGVGPETSDGRRGAAPEVPTQPLLNPPRGADVGDPPTRHEEVDPVPPHIIYASLKAAEEAERACKC